MNERYFRRCHRCGHGFATDVRTSRTCKPCLGVTVPPLKPKGERTLLAAPSHDLARFRSMWDVIREESQR